MQQHHRREVGQDLIKAEGWHGIKRWNNTKGWDDLEIVVVLVDEGEFFALGTDAEVVEDDVLLGVDEFGALALCALGFGDGVEDLLVWLAGTTAGFAAYFTCLSVTCSRH